MVGSGCQVTTLTLSLLPQHNADVASVKVDSDNSSAVDSTMPWAQLELSVQMGYARTFTEEEPREDHAYDTAKRRATWIS